VPIDVVGDEPSRKIDRTRPPLMVEGVQFRSGRKRVKDRVKYRIPLLIGLADGIFELEAVFDPPEVVRVKAGTGRAGDKAANFVPKQIVWYADGSRHPECRFDCSFIGKWQSNRRSFA
jgi:hypothetical protein